MRHRILVVEDEQAIADAVEFALGNEGYEVHVVADGEAAVVAEAEGYDLMVLDLMLPKLSGYEVCRQVRARSIVPILILTARTGEADRLLGLEVGADDYLGKPFSMAELVSRVRAILRRREMDRREGVALRSVGDLRIDLVERHVLVAGRPVELTPIEFRLLAFLADSPGRALSRREIMEHLGRSAHSGYERTCDAHVKNIRRKIELDPAHPERLVTVRGVGYLLRNP